MIANAADKTITENTWITAKPLRSPHSNSPRFRLSTSPTPSPNPDSHLIT